MSVFQEAGHIKNTVVLTFRHINSFDEFWVSLRISASANLSSAENNNRSRLPSVSHDYDWAWNVA